MSSSKLVPQHISISADKHFTPFLTVQTSLVIESDRKNSFIANRIPISHPYILYEHKNALLEGCHTSELTADICRHHANSKREIPKKILTRQIERMHARIDWHHMNHIWLTNLRDGMLIDDDECMSELLRVLRTLKITGYAFPVHVGDNGIKHIHVETPDFLPKWQWVYRKTGWSYIKAKDAQNRKEYIELSDDNPNNIFGFYATTQYNLCKYHNCKKNYYKI